MRHLLNSALSTSSAASYRHIFQLYSSFVQEHFGREHTVLPPNVQHLCMFISHCYQTGLAFATVTTYTSALSYIFKLDNFDDVTQHFVIKKVLQGYHKLRHSADTRLPITPTILSKLVDSLDTVASSYFHRVLFKAMFLLAFHAFLRVGEITSTGSTNQHTLKRGHVKVVSSTSGKSLEIIFPHFKHHHGQSSTHVVSAHLQQPHHCPVTAVQTYLELRKHEREDQPLFSFMDGSAISRNIFTNQLKLSLKWAGLNLQHYKSHSFRIGAATTAAMRGIPESDIQTMGRWKSEAFKKYIRILLISI